MKKLFLTLSVLFAMALVYSCSDDSSETVEEVNLEAEIEPADQERGRKCKITTQPCGYPNTSITCYFTPDPASADVIWTINGGDITAILGSGTSQTFNLGPNFTGGQISAIGGSFGCKDTIDIPACIQQNCSISGPNCGMPGDLITYTFNGASGQSVYWSATGSGLTLVGGQGTSSATFSMSNTFSNGAVNATTSGNINCSVSFPVTNCCLSQNMTINNKGVMEY